MHILLHENTECPRKSVRARNGRLGGALRTTISPCIIKFKVEPRYRVINKEYERMRALG